MVKRVYLWSLAFIASSIGLMRLEGSSNPRFDPSRPVKCGELKSNTPRECLPVPTPPSSMDKLRLGDLANEACGAEIQAYEQQTRGMPFIQQNTEWLKASACYCNKKVEGYQWCPVQPEAMKRECLADTRPGVGCPLHDDFAKNSCSKKIGADYRAWLAKERQEHNDVEPNSLQKFAKLAQLQTCYCEKNVCGWRWGDQKAS